MNAVTEIKPTTRTAVLRAMLFADSHVSCAQIAMDAGVSTNAAGASLRRLRDDGIVCSVDGDTGATTWYLNDPEAVRRTLDNDGTPGDDDPAPEPGDTQAVDAVEAAHLITAAYSAAYSAAIAAESAADEAPLAGEDVNGEADVLEDRRERYTDPVEAAADQIAAAVAAGQCPTVGLLGHARPVAAEAMRRAIDDAEVEALMREEEAGIALEMARDARVRGRAVAEIIRFADQRTGLAGDADPDAVLAAIVELLDGARSAVTGMSRPA